MQRSIKIALVASCVALFATVLQAAHEQYADISINQLKTAMDQKNVTLIDANGSDSYRAGHIAGAIDFEADGSKLGSMLPTDKNALIVAYCGGPQCMAYQAAAAKVAAMGYTNVRHLSAGISGWKNAGEKIEN